MLDDAAKRLLDQLAGLDLPPVHTLTPEAARAQIEQMSAGRPMPPAAVTVDEVEVDDAVSLRIVTPEANTGTGIIVWWHGGGWVLGSARGHEPLARRLADLTGVPVALVEYRLAPEHPYPAALDDSRRALAWIRKHLDEITGPMARIVLGGDSAGGNLVAALGATDPAAVADVALQLLVYPVTDSDLDRDSYADPDNVGLLPRASMAWFWDHYLPDPARRRDPGASPLRATSPDPQPPTVVVTAEHDVLRDEGEAYAAALEQAGTPVVLRRWPGQPHGFLSMVGVLPASDQALAFLAERIGAALSAPAADGGAR